jgi:hypothetical protein
MIFQGVTDPIHGRFAFVGITPENAGEELFLQAMVAAYHEFGEVHIAMHSPDGPKVSRWYSPKLMAALEAQRNAEGLDEPEGMEDDS